MSYYCCAANLHSGGQSPDAKLSLPTQRELSSYIDLELLISFRLALFENLIIIRLIVGSDFVLFVPFDCRRTPLKPKRTCSTPNLRDLSRINKNSIRCELENNASHSNEGSGLSSREVMFNNTIIYQYRGNTS